MHVTRLALLATLAAASACQVPVPVTQPAPGGDPITAELTPAGQQALAGYFGSDVWRVEGRIRAVAGDTVVMDVEQVTAHAGGRRLQPYEGLRLEKPWVSALTAKRTSVGRSLLAGAVGAAAAVGLGAVIAGGDLGITGGSGGGGGGSGR